jgi:pterin-4a-carbinolamine dehydratase
MLVKKGDGLPTAFISYRREDSSAAARWIARSISDTFGPDSVFIDTEAIRLGDNWPSRINEALEESDVLIVVIGRSWLTISDKRGRRLARKNDWVRNEIEHGIGRNITILPLLISGAKPPRTKDLTDDIKSLACKQALTMTDATWDRDLGELFKALEKDQFVRSGHHVQLYPVRELRLRDLNHQEVVSALLKLPNWREVPSTIPGEEPLRRVELRRVFEFDSFEDAICFINDVAKHAVQVDHHPRWENVWRTVTVWLSTWDIGQKPSQIDVDMAEQIDRLFAKYSPKVKPLMRGSKRRTVRAKSRGPSLRLP